MGLLEGVKKQYNLYNMDGDKVLTVIPLNLNVNNVSSYFGKLYFGKAFKNMTGDELNEVIQKFNLKTEFELNNQIDIYAFLED